MLGVTPALVRHPTRGSVTFGFSALQLEHTTQTPQRKQVVGFYFFQNGTQVPWDGWVVGSMSLIFFLSFSDRTCICLSSCICVLYPFVELYTHSGPCWPRHHWQLLSSPTIHNRRHPHWNWFASAA